MASATPDLTWNPDSNSMRQFHGYYSQKVPLVVQITEGYYGMDEVLSSFSNGDICLIYKKLTQDRVIFKIRGSNTMISVPSDYKVLFTEVDKDGQRVSGPLRPPAERLRDIVDRQGMSAEAWFVTPQSRDHAKFLLDGDEDHVRDLTVLEFFDTYEEEFFVAFTIQDEGFKIYPVPIVMPVYLPVKVSLANGVKTGDKEMFGRILQGLLKEADSLTCTHVRGNPEIMLYTSGMAADQSYSYVEPNNYLIPQVMARGSSSSSQPPDTPPLDSSSSGVRPPRPPVQPRIPRRQTQQIPEKPVPAQRKPLPSTTPSEVPVTSSPKQEKLLGKTTTLQNSVTNQKAPYQKTPVARAASTASAKSATSQTLLEKTKSLPKSVSSSVGDNDDNGDQLPELPQRGIPKPNASTKKPKLKAPKESKVGLLDKLKSSLTHKDNTQKSSDQLLHQSKSHDPLQSTDDSHRDSGFSSSGSTVTRYPPADPDHKGYVLTNFPDLKSDGGVYPPTKDGGAGTPGNTRRQKRDVYEEVDVADEDSDSLDDVYETIDESKLREEQERIRRSKLPLPAAPGGGSGSTKSSSCDKKVFAEGRSNPPPRDDDEYEIPTEELRERKSTKKSDLSDVSPQAPKPVEPSSDEGAVYGSYYNSASFIPIRSFTKEQVAEQLEKLKLGDFKQKFLDEEIDGMVLEELDKDVLVEMGMTRLQAAKVLAFVKKKYIPAASNQNLKTTM